MSEYYIKDGMSLTVTGWGWCNPLGGALHHHKLTLHKVNVTYYKDAHRAGSCNLNGEVDCMAFIL